MDYEVGKNFELLNEKLDFLIRQVTQKPKKKESENKQDYVADAGVNPFRPKKKESENKQDYVADVEVSEVSDDTDQENEKNEDMATTIFG